LRSKSIDLRLSAQPLGVGQVIGCCSWLRR